MPHSSHWEAPPHVNDPDDPDPTDSENVPPPPLPRWPDWRNESPDRDPGNWQPWPWAGPLPLHVDAKLKLSDLHEFTGFDDNIIPYFAKTNGLAEQSEYSGQQLGWLLPLCIKERAFN